MQTKSLIRALEKAGFIVTSSPGRSTISRDYYCEGKTHKAHWWDQEGYIVCVQVQRKNEHNDSQTDYFPGYFATTIKQVIQSLTS